MYAACVVAPKGTKRKAEEALLDGSKRRRFEVEIEEKKKLDQLAMIKEDDEEEKLEISDFGRSFCGSVYDHRYEDQEAEEFKIQELLQEMAERRIEEEDYYSSLYDELFGDDEEDDGQLEMEKEGCDEEELRE
ncbi:unnamed protein product [Bursaphelenchus xylophilus]|uniref:(pine wood nematode) hypothetical protein n=1 Tax=Bursaphelenchus xylophilus TaxID=6326 RepID=A0A1I7SKZ6_BURXY|nr:unnamed protein product [Bursaphelenchus xylophilus]CAG9129311.1 unnamed protein product [Bursaphelenchus xylophilus]